MGEDPQSADVSGIHVNARRRQSIYYAGLTSGLGGAFLVFVQIGRFEDSVVGGRGFIAIAAVIFGGWTLRGTIAGCVVFAGALSFRLSIQGLGYELNSELLQSLPFVVTLLGMAIFAHGCGRRRHWRDRSSEVLKGDRSNRDRSAAPGST